MGSAPIDLKNIFQLHQWLIIEHRGICADSNVSPKIG